MTESCMNMMDRCLEGSIQFLTLVSDQNVQTSFMPPLVLILMICIVLCTCTCTCTRTHLPRLLHVSDLLHLLQVVGVTTHKKDLNLLQSTLCS